MMGLNFELLLLGTRLVRNLQIHLSYYQYIFENMFMVSANEIPSFSLVAYLDIYSEKITKILICNLKQLWKLHTTQQVLIDSCTYCDDSTGSSPSTSLLRGGFFRTTESRRQPIDLQSYKYSDLGYLFKHLKICLWLKRSQKAG